MVLQNGRRCLPSHQLSSEVTRDPSMNEPLMVISTESVGEHVNIGHVL